MTTPPTTTGFRLRSISLVKCGFEYFPDLPQGELTPQNLTSDVEVNVEAVNDTQLQLPQLGQLLSVTLTGKLEGKPAWKATAAYAGLFEYTTGSSDVNLEQARQSAQAILYGFAREHLADIQRRANLPPVVPPILNFARTKQPANG